jgi:hypothetical protein
VDEGGGREGIKMRGKGDIMIDKHMYIIGGCSKNQDNAGEKVLTVSSTSEEDKQHAVGRGEEKRTSTQGW